MVTQNGETISVDRELERRNIQIGDDNTLPNKQRASRKTVAQIVAAVRQYERQSEVALREATNAEADARSQEAAALRDNAKLRAELQKVRAELLKYQTAEVADSFTDDDGKPKLTVNERKQLLSAGDASAGS